MEVLEAQVIEPCAELAVTYNAGSIISNIEAVKAYVDAELEKYAVCSVEDDAAWKQLKRDRADLNRLISHVDEARKFAKKEYMRPVEEFEVAIRTVLAPAKELEGRMGAEVNAYDERWKEMKRAFIRQRYEEYAPAIALPQNGAREPLVDYSRIENPKWLDRKWNEIAAVQAMEDIVDGIAEKESRLNELNLPYPVEARMEFFRTLDIDAAIRLSQQMEERAAAVRAIDEVRRSQEAAQATESQEVWEVPAGTIEEPQTAPEEAYEAIVECFMTVAQARKLVEWMRCEGIRGRVIWQ